MQIKKAILRNFDEINYLATVEITGSSRAYLEKIAVAKNLSAEEMVNGRNLAVLFFDVHNTRDAVVFAVYI
jgi:hypothetical protein